MKVRIHVADEENSTFLFQVKEVSKGRRRLMLTIGGMLELRIMRLLMMPYEYEKSHPVTVAFI